MKNNDYLNYEDRVLVSMKFCNWCYETNANPSNENFLVFLENKNFLNIKEIKKSLEKKSG